MQSKTHRISIPTVLETGCDVIYQLGTSLSYYSMNKVGLFFDEAIYKLFGKIIEKELTSHQIHFQSYIFDSTDYCTITSNAFTYPNDIQAFVALGGGKVLDSVKYMAFIRKLPFWSIPTSTSNDGFCSPVSSLMVNNKRTTVPSKIPFGILVDTNIVRSAPQKFIYSGIGDLVSNLTALFDWRYEESLGYGKIDHFASMISEKAVQSCIHYPVENIQEEGFLHELIYSLTMNGIAMEISGSSAPASGSEHLISHAMDQLTSTPLLHGIQVGLATYIVSKYQKQNFEEISQFLNKTGFIQYIKELSISRAWISEAIDIAPTIKPNRATVIHDKAIRIQLQEILKHDTLLQEILV